MGYEALGKTQNSRIPPGIFAFSLTSPFKKGRKGQYSLQVVMKFTRAV